MKTKNVLKSLFLSYLLTGVCLLLLAFLVFRFDLGVAPVSAGIVGFYAILCPDNFIYIKEDIQWSISKH